MTEDTRAMAEAALSDVSEPTADNPLTPLVRLVNALIGKQERKYGEALPHLYVAKETLENLEAVAQSEIGKNAAVFREPIDSEENTGCLPSLTFDAGGSYDEHQSFNGPAAR